MISRSYAWLDETVEHSEDDQARAAALAKRWSHLRSIDEDAAFQRQFDVEEGMYHEIEPEPCDVCGGDGFLGLDGPRTRNGDLKNLQDWQVGIKCPNENCEDGDDMGPIKEFKRAERERRAEKDIEIEWVEAQLEALGARMMRPYEHWNEDEQYVQYMENRSDY
jgi:hypothetical protein